MGSLRGLWRRCCRLFVLLPAAKSKDRAQKEVQQKNRTLELVTVSNFLIVIVAFCFANVMAGVVMLPIIQQRAKLLDKNDLQEKLAYRMTYESFWLLHRKIVMLERDS